MNRHGLTNVTVFTPALSLSGIKWDGVSSCLWAPLFLPVSCFCDHRGTAGMGNIGLEKEIRGGLIFGGVDFKEIISFLASKSCQNFCFII